MEARRGARVTTRFLVAVDGVEFELTPRTGDISATGIYFETDAEVGDVGTVQWLHLVSTDRARSVRVMAYVVRKVMLSELGGGTASGVAFEFMPENDDTAAAVHELVRHVLAMRHEGAPPHIRPRIDAHVGEDETATVRQLSVKSMVLETSWAMEPGEHVRVDIVAPGMTRRIRLDGRAVKVAAKRAPTSRYAIEVEIQKESERPIRYHSSMTFSAVKPEQIEAARAGLQAPKPAPAPAPEDDDVSRTLDDLLAALILPQEAPRNRRLHLSGQLSRIRLGTLLSLFDMERMTGKLSLQRGTDAACLYVRDGRLIDVEPAGAQPVRARIAQLLAWDEGAFELYVEPVERIDRVQTSTMALLLDLAREADEANRPPGS
jgi:hypothetical protein